MLGVLRMVEVRILGVVHDEATARGGPSDRPWRSGGEARVPIGGRPHVLEVVIGVVVRLGDIVVVGDRDDGVWVFVGERPRGSPHSSRRRRISRPGTGRVLSGEHRVRVDVLVTESPGALKDVPVDGGQVDGQGPEPEVAHVPWPQVVVEQTGPMMPNGP